MRTYKMIDKKKEFMGVLKDYNKEQITIEEPDGELRVLQRNELALVRPYVEFKEKIQKAYDLIEYRTK